jgi:hypothetical protein
MQFRKKVWLFAAVMFVLSGAAQAAGGGQGASMLDPGLQAVVQAKQVTPLKQAQTIDGLTLKWAYIDAHRAALAYTLHRLDGKALPEGMNRVSLKDDSGNDYSWSSGSGSRDSELTVATFYSPAFSTPPKTVKLHLEFTVAADSFTGTDNDQAVGPYTFDFTVPFNPARILKPAQKLNANGLEMRLESISATPSQTDVQLCYGLPDGGDWQPDVQLKTRDETYPLSNYSLMGLPSPQDKERCVKLGFLMPYTKAPITLSIPQLQTSMNIEDASSGDKIKAYLAKKGVEVKVTQDHGLAVELVRKPDDVDFNAALQEAYDSLRDKHAGPWTFTFKLP